jgi:hypothetical protein
MMCCETKPTVNITSRRGATKMHRLSIDKLVRSLLVGAIAILFIAYNLFYRSQDNQGLTEGFRHGNIRVSGLTGHISRRAMDSANPYDSKAIIGYAITVTDCPSGPEVADAAAVLKQSVHKNSIRNAESGSKYDYQMYALVHNDATQCVGSTLTSLGYKVLSRTSPIELKYIDGEYLRETLPSVGCCGVKEFTKLHAYTLVANPAVVLLDLDTLVMKPMDRLFDIMIDGPSILGDEGVEVAFGDPLRSSHYDGSIGIQAFYTRDYNIADSTMEQVPVQGGFMVIRPSLISYADFSSIIRKGDYQREGGWAGLGFGPADGSTAFQELIPYYYDHLHTGTAVELNRCVYNNMADNPRDNEGGTCKDKKEDCDDCRSQPIDEVSDKKCIDRVHYPMQC